MPALQIASVLRLHTAQDGHVWLGTDDRPGYDTGTTVDEFFGTGAYDAELDASTYIRVLGTRANAGLLAALQERNAPLPDKSKSQIQVGSPAVLSAGERADAERVMGYLWQPPATGYWHRMTPIDSVSYAMTNAIDVSGGRVPEVATRISQYHPAWPAVSFVAGFDPSSACRLLTDILDPRWYRHPLRPTRNSRLYSRLGLTPGNMGTCAGDDGVPGRNFNCATAAVRVWYNPTSRTRRDEPGGFLLRESDGQKSLARGLLRATQRLVDFVCAVWVDGLPGKHPECRFDPASFFHSSAEADAYDRHASPVCKRS